MTYAHEMSPGDSYEPLAFSISAEINQQFLFSIADFNSIYLGVGGVQAQVHPMVLLHMSARTRSKSFRLAPDTGSVFAKDEVRFREPAHVDETLTTRWVIKDVYERKGRLYQQLGIAISRGDVAILEREMHSVFFTRDGSSLRVAGAGT